MSPTFLHSEPGAEPVVIEGNFAAPPERVFRAWTNADELSQWFGTSSSPPESVDVDFRIGGIWQFTFAADDGASDTLHGEYVAIESGRRLVFSWMHSRTLRNGKSTTTRPSQVTVTFEPTHHGSLVRLVHESITSEQGRSGVGGGWNTSFTKLAALTAPVAMTGDPTV